MNLKTKFRLASSCLVLTVVVGTMISLLVYEKKKLLSDLEQEQIQELDKLARVCEDVMVMFDEPALFKYARNLVALSQPKILYAGFVYRSASEGSPWVWMSGSDRLTYVEESDANVRAVRDSGKIQIRDTRMSNQAVTELSKPVGRIGYVRLGYSRQALNAIYKQTIEKSVKRFSAVGLIAILFGLILAHIFSAALSKPIKNLMQAADQIAKGKKGVRLAEVGNDEIGQLTRTFNHMSEELIKLDQLKDDFMSHVTHELRSPLTSIIATIELLAEMPIANKDPKIRRSVDRLVFGSERLNRLVDNILDLTRLEAGKMQFYIQPINLGPVLCEMADFFEPRAMEKSLTIKAIVPEKFPMVMADPERIRQVISNLVHNAIKFTNKGGIVLWLKQEGSMAVVGVQDTGVGIPKDKLDSVFKKFECLKDTRDRVEKPVPGSGLGLNIVQNSIKAQGGSIRVESDVNKGTAFIFQLPLAPAAQQTVAPIQSSHAASTMLPNAPLPRYPMPAPQHSSVVRPL